MATKIVTKNSSTASAVPTASDLVQGELAVNVADKRLFTEDNAGAIVELGTNPTTLNVNGTATMDGLVVDGGAISTGDFTGTAAGSVRISGNGTTLGTTSFDLIQNSSGAYVYHRENLPLIFGTNNAERMRIDSSGNVGIGTASPNTGYALDVSGAIPAVMTSTSTVTSPMYGGLGVKRETNTNGNGTGIGFLLEDAGDVETEYAYIGGIIESNTAGSEDGGLVIATTLNNVRTQRMRIDSSGNVGIGTDTIIGSAANRGVLTLSGASSSFLTFGTGSTRWGGVYSSASNTIFLSDSISTFETGGVERMRIDSSGNLLVGKTTTGVSGAGVVLRGGGELFVTRAGDVMNLNRLTSDGEIAVFRKDGTAIGSIGVQGSRPYFGNNINFSIKCDDFGGGSLVPANQSGTPNDNLADIGTSVNRWDNIYATNGTIQTSDRNEKQDIAELSDAEQRVAVACKGLLRKFRWKDSVAEKGDEARIHFGIIAQDLQAAFAAEGLDASDYAMWCSDTWTDEETNEEKTRMGVRYSELLAFIIAAI